MLRSGRRVPENVMLIATHLYSLIVVPPIPVTAPPLTGACSFSRHKGALIGLYTDSRYKSDDASKKPLPLKSLEIIGAEVKHAFQFGAIAVDHVFVCICYFVLHKSFCPLFS